VSDRVCLRCFQHPCECREPRAERLEPREQVKLLRRRNALLEGLLRDAWAWSTERLGRRTDQLDIEALRTILSRGDVKARLDHLLDEAGL
jgi:hypothetical protein